MNGIELRITYKGRTISTWLFTNTTTIEEFDRFIRSKIVSDELKDYDIQYKDPANRNNNTLDKNQSNFLAPVFRCATVLTGVHSSTSAQNFVNIFIEPILQGGGGQINASSSATYNEESQILLDFSPEFETFWQDFQQHREDYVSQENACSSIDYQGDVASTKHIHQSEGHSVDENSPMPTTSNNSDSNEKHIRMIHDVNPEPGRWRYISDVVPKRPARERKSVAKRSHALLSGVKGPNQKNCHIRPIISIPSFILGLIKSGASVVLWIAGVTEEKIGNERVWRLHLHTEFRQPSCNVESDDVNPVKIVLNQGLVQHGQLTIEVILTKKPYALGTEPKGLVLHKLDEDSVQKLHVAEHNNKLIRLAFILSIDGLRDINTFGLSGFMDFTPKHKSDQISVQPKICQECNQPIKRKRPAKKRSTAYSDSDSGMTEE
ncbi:unnamed protein product [Adineta steineri]|uniref:Uncharacterized protein n=1 Tax=Adineta steineri TaxID=433720 RepID=A0A814EMJ8_9BILA|nr:unnamed protein product [Adineta steineri]CAF4137771.1 unnamed protein product [Adineta steineri]